MRLGHGYRTLGSLLLFHTDSVVLLVLGGSWRKGEHRPRVRMVMVASRLCDFAVASG